MTNTPTCPECGSELASDGRCAVCRLRAALGNPASAATPQGEIPAGAQVRSLGDFELLEIIGRGGMGQVYRARQISLNRFVALKLIHAGRFASSEEVARFRREAESAARLDHPNIVHIYEVGCHQGQDYFTMKFVEGGTLAQRLSHLISPISNRAAATLLSKVARALHHAHQRGIMHRDLKPANLLLTPEGEPLIADFGLARLIDASVDPSRPEGLLGTPGYMAPEQFAGKSGDLTTAVDIHALGCILYELLTGQTPYRAGNLTEAIQTVPTQPITPPRQLNPRLDRDLEAICLKCLRKQPEKRYPSAATLADDLDHWLKGEPVSAREITPLLRVLKWGRRHPLKLALILALHVAIGAPVGLAVYYQVLELRPGDLAEPLQPPDAEGVYALPLTAGEPPRCTVNFEAGRRFTGEGRLYRLNFLSVPPARLPDLRVRILADHSRPDDPSRSVPMTNGQIFRLRAESRADRAFYFVAEGFDPAALHAEAPNARLELTPVQAGQEPLPIVANRPRIRDVTPLIAAPGANVVITGENISPDPEANVVFFGPVRAKVLSAQTNALSVQVPLGAGYAPVTVSTPARLTAYAPRPFLPSFGGNARITAESFAPTVSFPTPVAPYYAAVGDLDGDGRPDLLATTEKLGVRLTLLRNTGTAGRLTADSFAPAIGYGGAGNAFFLAVGDLDGDGRLDVVFPDNPRHDTSPCLDLYLNACAPGSITDFLPAGTVWLPPTALPHNVVLADLDGDGRPELILPDYNNPYLYLLQNRAGVARAASPSRPAASRTERPAAPASGTNQTVKAAPVRNPTDLFAPPVRLPAIRAYRVAVGDLDGDGKPDLVVAGLDHTLRVLRNVSTPGRLDSSSFDTVGTAPIQLTGGPPASTTLVDLDGDGKLDVVIAHAFSTSHTLTLLRNTSEGGLISFAAPITVGDVKFGSTVQVADFYGDGRPDLVVNHYTSSQGATIFQNDSRSGVLTLTPAAFLGGDINRPAVLTVADVDGDGKPDLILADDQQTRLQVLRNQSPAASR